MATTRLSNIIEPKIFAQYVLAQTVEKSAVLNSGIITRTPEAAQLANSGGTVMDLPHWNVLDYGESSVGSDDPDRKGETAGITAAKQVAQKNFRNKAWSSMALAGLVAGSDPMQAIATFAANYWSKDLQNTLLAMLKGIAVNNVADNGGDMVVNVATDGTGAVTAAQKAGYATIADTFQTMGDAQDSLGMIVMHSFVKTELQKSEPGAWGPISAVAPFGTYYGRTVIVTDACPVEQGTNRKTYTTFMLGQGAFAYGEGDLGEDAAEVGRDPHSGDNSGEDKLFTRKAFVLHPRGYQSLAAVTAPFKSPTNAQFAAEGALKRVYDRKLVPIAILKTNG
ncbi:major capsid protein [Sphingobium yanoikuyae]|jgi:hypothetical protein|uniref:major capsid protein n=1 Tax=Sphingobium yanoikuyae TaxID=13690 RepID=UPI0035C7C328